MGRQIKRVPLDFDWPLNEIWEGYENPYYKDRHDCPACDGTGYSPLALALEYLFYPYSAPSALPIAQACPQSPQRTAVIDFITTIRALPNGRGSWHENLTQYDVDVLWKAGRLFNFGSPENGNPAPAAEQVNFRYRVGFGHDAINRMLLIEGRLKLWDIETHCSHCGGTGDIWPTPEHQQRCEEWEPTDPPEGTGWQLWETTSEGSPISPVFATPDEFSAYLIGQGYSEGAAEEFVRRGYAPTMIAFGTLRGGITDVKDGIEALNDARMYGSGDNA